MFMVNELELDICSEVSGYRDVRHTQSDLIPVQSTAPCCVVVWWSLVLGGRRVLRSCAKLRLFSALTFSLQVRRRERFNGLL